MIVFLSDKERERKDEDATESKQKARRAIVEDARHLAWSIIVVIDGGQHKR